MLDSGSDLTLVDSKFAYSHLTEKTNIRIYNANGNKMNVLGCVKNASLLIDDEAFYNDIYVVEKLESKFILGADFMQKHSMNIGFKAGKSFYRFEEKLKKNKSGLC